MTEIAEAMMKAAEDPSLSDEVRKALLGGAAMIRSLRTNIMVSNQMMAMIAQEGDLDVDQTVVRITSDVEQKIFSLRDILVTNDGLTDFGQQQAWFSRLPPPPPLPVAAPETITPPAPAPAAVVVIEEIDEILPKKGDSIN